MVGSCCTNGDDSFDNLLDKILVAAKIQYKIQDVAKYNVKSKQFTDMRQTMRALNRIAIIKYSRRERVEGWLVVGRVGDN